MAGDLAMTWSSSRSSCSPRRTRTKTLPATARAASTRATKATMSLLWRLTRTLGGAAMLGFGRQPVASAPHRLDAQPAAPELLAQPGDVHVHRPEGVERRAPDQVEQLLAVEGDVGEAGEGGEQVELPGRQGQSAPVERGGAARQVELQAVQSQPLLLGLAPSAAGPPQNRLAARPPLVPVVGR